MSFHSRGILDVVAPVREVGGIRFPGSQQIRWVVQGRPQPRCRLLSHDASEEST
jgi:hypothetical protein